MTKSTPKTLEYSTIKRSRRHVVMIVVLVLASIAVALVGNAWLGRLRWQYDQYHRSHEVMKDILDTIALIESNKLNLHAWPSGVQSVAFPRSGTTSSVPDIWNDIVTKYGGYTLVNAGGEYTACLAVLDAGNGDRVIVVGAVENQWSNNLPDSLTYVVRVADLGGWGRPIRSVGQNITPGPVWRDSLIINVGTRDPNHPDRATFKVIADGVEKTFVVILRKDDTIAFEEQPSN